MVKVRAFQHARKRAAAFGVRTSPGSTKWAADVSPGPVVAGAVILESDRYIPRVCDSKTVTALERDRLYDQITRRAMAWSVISVEPEEIDRVNIHQASLRAMHRAVLGLTPLPDMVLVDAFRIPDLPMAQRGVVHGDSRCTAIAAASIVAKVTRDRLMHDLHGRDPRYGFDRHKGMPRGIIWRQWRDMAIPRCIAARSGRRHCLINSIRKPDQPSRPGGDNLSWPSTAKTR